jgi:hypothetical protein
MADYRALGESRIQDNTDGNDGRTVAPHFDYPLDDFYVNVSEIFDELKELLLSKHRDYGPKNISQSPGGPLNGLRVRMHDKTARINNLVDKGLTAEHEPLEDSFKDLANYGVIALLVLRGKWDRE